MRLGVIATFILTLVLPGAALAQLGGTSGAVSGAPFTVSVSPQYPVPYSKAAISFLSDSLDLANATVAVSVAGKKTYQGSVRPVAVTLGKAGSVTTVSVTISSGSSSYSQSISIQPQDVALVAEPISSAPPLYPGKSRVPLEGDVRVVAIANLRNAQGKVFDPGTLSYSWTVEDTRVANFSGIGKQAIIVASPLQYRTRDVMVRVVSQDGNVIGGATLSLSPEEPTLRVYENDPLLGVRYDRALSNAYAITGAEATLYAAPFSLPTTSGAPLIQWFLNGAPAQRGNSITLRPTGSGGGRASLSVVASSGVYTTVTALLSLSFGETAGSNFFGL